MEPTYHMLGDKALLVTFSRQMSQEANDTAIWVSHFIENLGIRGVSEVQPTYSALCVHFDPSVVTRTLLADIVKDSVAKAGASQTRKQNRQAAPGRLVGIPVVYGGSCGPDLPWAASHLGLEPGEIVRRHAAVSYRVHMIGFTPGFPYLGGMDESIALPRLAEPRKTVPAGSVGIAEAQTGVYPWDSPGGWRIIGKTAAKLFHAKRAQPSLLRAGDTVRFIPVTEENNISRSRESQKEQHAASIAPAPVEPQLPGFTVENPGFFTLVVDRGRQGYRKLGVPVSGAADSRSYFMANRVLGNTGGEAALEMTLLGARLRALRDVRVAISGAFAPVTLNGYQAGQDVPVQVPKDSILEVGPMTAGCRMYLAAEGGFAVPPVMGSASTCIRCNFGGHGGRPLRTGDVLNLVPRAKRLRRYPDGMIPAYTSPPGENVVLRVMPGPEATRESLQTLCSSPYTVRPESDRMGLRLDGPQLFQGPGDILSSAVVPGTIQVPSDGKPILLLADAQTTGGYRRLGCVISQDLPLAGQLRPGARVRFAHAL